ncbi:MAG: gamma-glutamyl-gamma-aminobutyrate hydrolase family protein, partial [Synergistaceae bacterium]|nr:gamma-glutamyl-gamma-aminobutyrate hydrolase family protein [Synergistaceae bacterium]
MNENIIIINCGSQFTQLIARRLREMKVHSVILNWDVSHETVSAYSPKGIIISGGPDSVNDSDAIMIDREILNPGCPVLGICYGMQLLAKLSGGNVQKVLVGREIASSPTVLLTAYVVRGLDINSSYTIYDLINKQKERGVAVVYV